MRGKRDLLPAQLSVPSPLLPPPSLLWHLEIKGLFPEAVAQLPREQAWCVAPGFMLIRPNSPFCASFCASSGLLPMWLG